MILERFPELEKLSLEERALLYSELGDTLFDDAAPDRADPTILELLEKRHQEYLANPDLARPAEEVLARLRSRYSDRPSA
jgi:hypothetical protein